MKRLINLFALLLLVSCSSDDGNNVEDNAPLSLTVTVSNVTDHEATLTWTVSGNTNAVTYRVVLDNQTIVDGYNDTSYTLTGLDETTSFSGSVFAFEQGAEQAFQEFNFTTLLDTTFEGDLSLTTQNEIDNFIYTSVSGELILWGNEINSLSGLASLKEVGHLTIQFTELNTLKGLENLDRFSNGTGRIHLEENQNLNNVNSLSNISSYIGTLILKDLPSLMNLTGLNIAENGNLTIRNCLVSDLSVFQNVSKINNLIISEGTPNINDFEDFQSLEEIDLLWIRERVNKISLSALANVSIKEDLWLEFLPGLQSLDGIQGTTNLSNRLILRELPNVSHLNGLNNLQAVGSVLQDGPFGALYIDELPITDLTGLENLEQTSYIQIYDCDNLTSLDGTQLISAKPEGFRLKIKRNSNLTNYCGFRDLANNVNFVVYEVGTNGYNPTQAQMRSNTDCSL
ncbi:fibronectin type III domain-containing protein [Aureisphaera galaxeae]|uniref:fibronectin type III domain-containing protein n=1 Tax=Aureisphaera galaxeae TaxID=1538023 RepID=UPI0023506A89|nr:fibronectin type III domain-containing protein [Aureisphaera galaxeae]MDC8006095.1 fibronectin type III domain-containing protein [Aureisphaera galaxeae]